MVQRATAVRRLATIVSAAVLLGACGAAPAPRPTPRVPATAVATPQTGCGTAWAAGSTRVTLTVAGRDRFVVVHVPTGYTGSGMVPLVLNLHGSRNTAEGQEHFSGMNRTANLDGFIVAYPQAFIASGPGFDWNIPGLPLFGGRAVPPGSANDVSFLTSLVGILRHRYCIDPDRVYATGFSGGARMTSLLGCVASRTFAAIAPVSGLRLPSPCDTTRPMPVVAFHGTADPVDPYDGHGESYWTYSVPHAARIWAEHDHCTTLTQSAQTDPAGMVAAFARYSGCPQGADVDLWTLVGEGHEWPGGPRVPDSVTSVLGPQSFVIDADSVMWEFFSHHPMPNASGETPSPPSATPSSAAHV